MGKDYYYPRRNSRAETILLNRALIAIQEHPNATAKQLQVYIRYFPTRTKTGDVKYYSLSQTKLNSLKNKAGYEEARKEIKQYYVVGGKILIYDADIGYDDAGYRSGVKVGQLYKDEIIYPTVSLKVAKRKFNQTRRKWNKMITFYHGNETIEVEGELYIDIYNYKNQLGSTQYDYVRFN